jgi:hypothetical protein
MTGADTVARIHGTVESILFARASSIAPADQGDVKTRATTAVVLGRVVLLLVDGGLRREGEISGEEKERRYSDMKKSSLRAQKVKRTFCLVEEV